MSGNIDLCALSCYGKVKKLKKKNFPVNIKFVR